ncbi:unnamed protein product [Nyctereutes procyonoides]|uniref:transketolase n=1 Tax=Nyctereutes procyonoides TaxID=34880 RepID=A0A811ZNC4_NYCPR|nr:unnamed protein product [Nyctereutes procyonoides]
MAYTGKYFDKTSYCIYCVMGDGELICKLDNLIAILDINRLGQSDPTPLQHQVDIYQKRCESFGWHAVIVDGHSMEELCKAFGQAKHQPTAIIAKTFKGRGIPGIEDKDAWRGKPLPKNMADQIVQEIHNQIQSQKKILVTPPQEDAPSVNITNIRMPSPPSYKVGDKIATRKDYGQALAKVGHRSSERSTQTASLSATLLSRTWSVSRWAVPHNRMVPFCSAFGAFFTPAFDQIPMAAISESNINFYLAMFRSIPTGMIFYTSNGVSTEKAVELAANTKGICFIQTSHPENAIIYNNNEDFQIKQAKVVLKSKDDQVTVIGAGVTLHEALAAADLLKKEKINIRVLDPFTIKPLDRNLILESARATKGRIVTVEDHYYEGGIGEAESSAVVGEPGITVSRLAVGEVPKS